MQSITKQNDIILENIVTIATDKIMCSGSKAPFDHPHVYLDLAKNGEVLCPYCGVKYIYKNV